MTKTTAEVRRGFIDYFRNKGHSEVASSPVVPHEDPTLLFINAGMNQFKDVFLGTSKRDYTRAVTSQKCIRVGGKHNDLENVGHTTRHLTFFEMLGNFSFGDYFKKEAIDMAWELSTTVFGFAPERIWPTVFRDDDEAFELWTQYVPAERITRMDEKDNFWSMGDTGPCGPCSELFYDHSPEKTDIKSPAEDEPGNRFLEFWNLVFMQFNRSEDGSMTPLPRPSIDTGAGIERVMQLIQGVNTVFDTDVLRRLIGSVEEALNISYNPADAQSAAAFRVIADHIRCLCFAIADGSQPSNTERGYVLRKVLRRAVRYGRQLANIDQPFLAKLVPTVVHTMGEAYPELGKAQERICELLSIEEEQFLRTLRRGKNLMEKVISDSQQSGQISGQHAFTLKDTYGFPIDEILLIAKDQNLTVDIGEFERLEEEARERSRQVHKSTSQVASENLFESFVQKNPPCVFTGYDACSEDAQVVALLVDDQFVQKVSDGTAIVILDKTPFYAEKGGQVGDKGALSAAGFEAAVYDTQNPYEGVITHAIKIKQGQLSVGDRVSAEVDAQRRALVARNHTATHLMHWALQKVLGEHIVQAGSVVDAERLRFDFSHHKGVSQEEIRQIEDMVNDRIRENRPVSTYELSYDEAQQRSDIKQFFGDKYGATVRVVDLDFSKELCGGTHVLQSGDIGYFRIAKESSISAGVRRIEAVTGRAAEAFARESEDLIETLASSLKTLPGKLIQRVEKLVDENTQAQKELKRMRQARVQQEVRDLVDKSEEVSGIRVLASTLAAEPADLKHYADAAMELMGSGVCALGASDSGRCQLLIRVGDAEVSRGVHAGNLVKELAPMIGGKGGGKALSAQAGGDQPDQLSAAIQRINELIEKQVSAAK